MPTEPLLLQFDYLPVLKFEDQQSCVVGLAPTHAAISFVDSCGQRFRALCPPAMVSVRWSDEAMRDLVDSRAALAQSSLDIVRKLMFDFSHRPQTVLRGIWLAARGQESPSIVTYLRRITVAIERGQECLVHAVPHLDAEEVVRKQIAVATHYNDRDRLARIEKGITILREALELDAKSAMSVLTGEPRDFERERIDTHGGEIETPFGRGSVVDVSALKRVVYSGGFEGQSVGDEVELTEDLIDGMGV